MFRNVLLPICLVLVLFTLISCKGGERSADTIYSKDFSLLSLSDNKKVSLNTFKGKPLVINFWASWCSPCREEMPVFEKVWRQYRAKGVLFIGINVLDDKKDAKEFLETLNISYPNLQDPSGEMLNSFGVTALPVTLFVDKEGKVIRKNYGAFIDRRGEESFISYIEEIL
ncbi:Thiol-disulfide oxidoreductase ResA [bacterium HR37]|nr:Thiol-disulfide oxidoreductase ResA [bacterium HR37]